MRRVTVEEAHALWNLAGVKVGMKITKDSGNLNQNFAWFTDTWVERHSADLAEWKQVEKTYGMLFFSWEEGDEIPESLR